MPKVRDGRRDRNNPSVQAALAHMERIKLILPWLESLSSERREELGLERLPKEDLEEWGDRAREAYRANSEFWKLLMVNSAFTY
jgi:hypothetical protein